MVKVLSLGAPLMDSIFWVDDHFIKGISGEKGGMELVTFEELCKLKSMLGSEGIQAAGGSQANTLKGLAHLGEECLFVGHLGKDEIGDKYEALLKEQGIQSLFTRSDTEPTGQVFCMVTPDGQRTMRTFLGASTRFDPLSLNSQLFNGVSLFHLSAYSFLEGPIVDVSMRMAKSMEAHISLSLASFEVVRRFRMALLRVISDHVDFVFANEDEAKELVCGKSPEDACGEIAELCDLAVVHMGDQGCWAEDVRGKIHHHAYKAQKIVDSTGAGDVFTAAFLWRYLQGKELEDCAHYAALAGQACVQVVGAELNSNAWKAIKG